MNPKERRNKLFGKQSPTVRKIEFNDMRWLYAAHKLVGGELDQNTFSENFALTASLYQEVFVVDDFNKSYKDGRGPVGIVSCRYDQWRFEPSTEWFPWANKRNILRSAVSFLLYCRYSKDIGVTYVHAPDKDKKFFTMVKKYVSLYPIKSIPGGLPSGDDNLFYIRGKKRHGTI